MFRRLFRWLKQKAKYLLGAAVMLPAKVFGFVGDTLTTVALSLYKGTPKHNIIAENLSAMYSDLADQYAESIDYSDVIEEIVNDAVEDITDTVKESVEKTVETVTTGDFPIDPEPVTT